MRRAVEELGEVFANVGTGVGQALIVCVGLSAIAGAMIWPWVLFGIVFGWRVGALAEVAYMILLLVYSIGRDERASRRRTES